MHATGSPTRSEERRLLEQLVVAVCPDAAGGVIAEVVAEVEATMAALSPSSRMGLRAGLRTMEQLSRLTRIGRGRAFSRLDSNEARALTRAALAGESVVPQVVATMLRSVVVAAYFDVPAVRAELGYEPEEFIRSVTLRRRERWGHELDSITLSRWGGPK